MRNFHRICAILVSLGLAYIAVTGIWMQVLDLNATIGGKPYDDPTVVSINEGYRGEENYAVAKTADFKAQLLPAGLDYSTALGTVLKGFHATAQGVPPRFVELRVVDGKVVGRVQGGETITSFDTASGQNIGAMPALGDRDHVPPSLRQTIKQWHRMAGLGMLLGPVIDLLFGLGFLALLLTGYVMYWRLIKVRRKIGKPSPFWSAGGQMRTLHRGVSLGASIFLVMVALSGTWIAFESAYMSISFMRPSSVAGYSVGKLGVIGDQSSPLGDAQVQQMAKATLAAWQRDRPGQGIRVLRLRSFGAMRQGVVIDGSREPQQVAYNATSGRMAGLTEPEYPASGFPFGVAVHEWDKAFHSGKVFGLTGRAMNLLAGFALLFLSVLGIVMYIDLWRKRRLSGRGAFFWT